MPYCPNCGHDVGNAVFCPNCGAKQGERVSSQDPSYSPSPPGYQPVRRGSGVEYNEMICLVLCCCVTPIAAIIYYLLTEHPEKYPQNQY